MDKMKELRTGVAEMRSVASRLLLWADDLEKSFHDSETAEGKVEGDGGESSGSVGSEPLPDPCTEKGKTLSLPEVRAILAEKCAAGFGEQVKALIASYGTSSLGSVPCERYGELVEAAEALGVGVRESVSGGDMDAG